MIPAIVSRRWRASSSETVVRVARTLYPLTIVSLSRANGHSDFTLLSAEFTRIQRLGGPLSVAFSAAGQVALVPLLTSQQFGLGGRRFGRGYEPSELTGDDGAALSIEPRVDFAIADMIGAQLYAFYDVGRVWRKEPLLGEAREEELSSAGAGVRVSIGSNLSAGFELAWPLTRDVASQGDRDVRPLFDIAFSF